jgi:hypothetical protein
MLSTGLQGPLRVKGGMSSMRGKVGSGTPVGTVTAGLDWCSCAQFEIGFQVGVQFPAGEDGGVGDPDLLDLLQVEEARAIGQSVQGHDADWRGVGIKNGQRNHEEFSGSPVDFGSNCSYLDVQVSAEEERCLSWPGSACWNVRS